MAIKRCKAAFAIPGKGGDWRLVHVGDLVDSSDPLVQSHEANFEDVDTYVSERKARVEQATAVPGEKRSVGRPAAKKTATPVKKAAVKPEVKQDPKDDSSKEGTS